jgi:hypothetical protein
LFYIGKSGLYKQMILKLIYDRELSQYHHNKELDSKIEIRFCHTDEGEYYCYVYI